MNRATRARDQIAGRSQFGVNILASGQQDVSNVCSRPGTDKGLPSAWLLDGTGSTTPVLRAALAHLDCGVARVYEESTHSIFVGEVRRILLGDGRDPLVYFDGSYCVLESKAEASFDILWERYSRAFL